MNKKDIIKNKELLKAFWTLKDIGEAKRFIRDLLTEQEIVEFGNRWKAAQMLYAKLPYSQIIEETGLSSTTIARVSKWLRQGKDGYRLVLERQNNHHSNSSRGKELR